VDPNPLAPIHLNDPSVGEQNRNPQCRNESESFSGTPTTLVEHLFVS
jgi:hypothetical protein